MAKKKINTTNLFIGGAIGFLVSKLFTKKSTNTTSGSGTWDSTNADAKGTFTFNK